MLYNLWPFRLQKRLRFIWREPATPDPPGTESLTPSSHSTNYEPEDFRNPEEYLQWLVRPSSHLSVAERLAQAQEAVARLCAIGGPIRAWSPR